MRRKTAKEILTESFRELAERKHVDRITVKEITENCGYSTATFYRQFRDKYDLIAWDWASRTALIMERVGKDGYVWRDTLLDGARSFQEQKDYLANLFLHTSGLEAFLRYQTELNYSVLRDCVAQTAGEIDQRTDMYLRAYCAGTVQLTCDWALGRYQVSPEELAEVYERALPEPLRQYLYPK